MIRLLRLRRLVQVAVLLLLAALPWLNRDGFTGMKGSLFAFDFFGLPFADPLGAVQIGLSGIIPGWRLIAGALVVLAVALYLGRIFCSWFCPFGFLSELVHAIRGRRPPKPLKHGFRSRAVIALVGLALVPLLGFPLLSWLSLVIVALIPAALKGVKYRELSSGQLLTHNLRVWGLGGIVAPFVFIKIIDMLLALFGIGMM